jgi:hypothetical protein
MKPPGEQRPQHSPTGQLAATSLWWAVLSNSDGGVVLVGAGTKARPKRLSIAVTCCQAGRRSRRLIVSTGTLRCSMNGLPLQDRSPQRLSSAYSLSRMVPRTLRTFMGPEGRLDADEARTLADLGAGERVRTAGLPFTRRLLCLLSYTGWSFLSMVADPLAAPRKPLARLRIRSIPGRVRYAGYDPESSRSHW